MTEVTRMRWLIFNKKWQNEYMCEYRSFSIVLENICSQAPFCAGKCLVKNGNLLYNIHKKQNQYFEERVLFNKLTEPVASNYI